MLAVTEMGGIVAPPVPAFYTRPQTINDIIDQTIGRTLDLFDIDAESFPRWGEAISLLSAPENGAAEEFDAVETEAGASCRGVLRPGPNGSDR
jgi:hypothetical protein